MVELIEERQSAGLWGSSETRYFYSITPEVILSAVESLGYRCTGRCLALNSLENRVYEVEIEVDEAQITYPYDRFRIIKFYRPGRWSKEQILEEHQFLLELCAAEIPVVAPEVHDGRTLRELPEAQIFFAVFPKAGGRSPAELDDEQLERVGRLLARIHNVGASRPFNHRLALTPASYGLANLHYLLRENIVPAEIVSGYSAAVEGICKICDPWFAQAEYQRVHGDAHLGNLLWRDEGITFVDFDDSVRAPCVQDLWLVVQGRDEEAQRRMQVLLNAYEQMRAFDRRTLRLIEALRALRMVHFAAWIAHRRKDPAFKSVFQNFGTQQYWMEQTADMQEQWQLVRAGGVWD